MAQKQKQSQATKVAEKNGQTVRVYSGMEFKKAIRAYSNDRMGYDRRYRNEVLRALEAQRKARAAERSTKQAV